MQFRFDSSLIWQLVSGISKLRTNITCAMYYLLYLITHSGWNSSVCYLYSNFPCVSIHIMSESIERVERSYNTRKLHVLKEDHLRDFLSTSCLGKIVLSYAPIRPWSFWYVRLNNSDFGLDLTALDLYSNSLPRRSALEFDCHWRSNVKRYYSSRDQIDHRY